MKDYSVDKKPRYTIYYRVVSKHSFDYFRRTNSLKSFKYFIQILFKSSVNVNVNEHFPLQGLCTLEFFVLNYQA